VPLRSLDAVFITHLHSDHIAGSPDFYATSAQGAGGRRPSPLNLHGPAGIDNVARGIELIFTDNNRIRLAGQEILPGSLTITTHDNSPEGWTVYDRDGIKVAAFLVDHGHVKPLMGIALIIGLHVGFSLMFSRSTSTLLLESFLVAASTSSGKMLWIVMSSRSSNVDGFAWRNALLSRARFAPVVSRYL